MALPEKLYTLRKKSGLSQEQLAEALNVSRQASPNGRAAARCLRATSSSR